MDNGVKVCVEARANFFSQYYSVPQELQNEVNGFINELYALGEESADTAQFEERFALEGYSEKFNSLLSRCTPVPYKMTKEQKKESRKIYGEMLNESRGEIAKDIANDVADSVSLKLESELIEEHRRIMIESGTLDEYTRATNLIEDAQAGAGFLGRLFGKNKN